MSETKPIPTEILIRFARSNPPIICVSLAELDAALDRLHAERLDELRKDDQMWPLHVSISFLDHEINLGLGSEDSFVMIGTKPFDDWYYANCGNETVGEDKPFYGIGDDSYWPRNWLVPIDAAREAVRYFVIHQQRSPLLGWDC